MPGMTPTNGTVLPNRCSPGNQAQRLPGWPIPPHVESTEWALGHSLVCWPCVSRREVAMFLGVRGLSPSSGSHMSMRCSHRAVVGRRTEGSSVNLAHPVLGSKSWSQVTFRPWGIYPALSEGSFFPFVPVQRCGAEEMPCTPTEPASGSVLPQAKGLPHGHHGEPSVPLYLATSEDLYPHTPSYVPTQVCPSKEPGPTTET